MSRLLVVPLLLVLVGGLVAVSPDEARAAETYHVATDGKDSRPGKCEGGSSSQPWRTLEYGMRCLRPGDTLLVRGGTYDEIVLPVITPGRADAPIRVAAHPGERVNVRGYIRLDQPDHWHLDRINVTSLPGHTYSSGEYLVKIRGGTGWSFTRAQVWNARSYAALRIERTGDGSGPRNWRVAGNCIHSTRPTHGSGQDHNVYIDTGPDSGGGVVERNIIFDAPNGTNIKLGAGADASSVTRDVNVRFNTLWSARQNVLANGGTRAITVNRNIIGGTIVPADKTWYPNIRGYALSGPDNVAAYNVGHGTRYFIFNDRESRTGWRDIGGNRHPVNPRFDAVDSCRGFNPGESSVKRYGRHAPQVDARSIDRACPPGQVPSRNFRDVSRDDVHARAIDCVAWWEVAGGYADNTYRPSAPVNRAQMASFIANLILESGGSLPPPGDRFDDVSAPHAESIERLAAAGVVDGVGGRRFAPDRRVTRAQMATFLANAYRARTGAHLPATADYFIDDDGTGHETSINRVAEAGITGGLRHGDYGSAAPVNRAAMASFVARTLDVLVERHGVRPPS